MVVRDHGRNQLEFTRLDRVNDPLQTVGRARKLLAGQGTSHQRRGMSYFTLTPNYATPDSPGSSIFDLPTQPPGVASGSSTKVHSALPGTPDPTHGDGIPSHIDIDLERQAQRVQRNTTDTQDDLAAEAGENRQEGPSFLVVSGGTGCNSICAAFGNACYVLPVSDDGGSSSEIIRVIGGPSIGACGE